MLSRLRICVLRYGSTRNHERQIATHSIFHSTWLFIVWGKDDETIIWMISYLTSTGQQKIIGNVGTNAQDNVSYADRALTNGFLLKEILRHATENRIWHFLFLSGIITCTQSGNDLDWEIGVLVFDHPPFTSVSWSSPLRAPWQCPSQTTSNILARQHPDH